MRELITNAQDTFRVKAYAGTNGVLLAFDLDELAVAHLSCAYLPSSAQTY